MVAMDISGFTMEMMNMIPLLYKVCFSTEKRVKDPLPATQMQVLIFLSSFSPLNMKQISECLKISKQQLTKVVDALVDKQLVTRKEGERNRRHIFINVTSKGLSLANEMLARRGEMITEILGSIPLEKRHILTEGLLIFKEALLAYNAKHADTLLEMLETSRGEIAR